jgi:CRP/FNR family transcriptional regulator, anaerobic regulatory protein
MRSVENVLATKNNRPSIRTRMTDLIQLPIIQPLSQPSKEAFVAAVSVVRHPRHHVLFQPEHITPNAYFVLRGAIRQYYLADGKEVVTRLVLEHGIAGSIYSFLSQKAGYEYGEAVEDVELAVMPYQAMERLCGQFIDIANMERKITEQYLVHEHERALALQYASAQERYTHLMRAQPNVFLRFPLGSIASFLGMSQETLSRLRAKNV